MNKNELAEVARAALDWIDALPADVVAKLPVMPGFDRDWAEETIKAAESPCICSDVESVLGLLESNEWAEHCTKTPLGNRLESVITELVAKSHIQPMPDHEIRETVNQLRDIAKQYAHTEQLRERIAYCIVDKLKGIPTPQPPHPLFPYVTVPTEPTIGMCYAMGLKWESNGGFPTRYKAMLAEAMGLNNGN